MNISSIKTAQNCLQNQQLVWGKFTRTFHWLLVLLFVISYYSASHSEDTIHALSGYAMTILLSLRLLWGIFGSDHAIFSRFTFSLSEVWIHAQQIAYNKPQHYLGHSPMGAMMVFALLILLCSVVTLGLISQAWTEYEGPLWFIGWMPHDLLGRFAENWHECLPDVLIIFIVLHLLGVALACYQHRENLVLAMIRGYKSH